ncbi:gliding motility lipoprotein GldH [Formosa sp. A9]|uniref:gliding motility lipoprotein GldH n=1 Tax=Formosa sp. A9 TaxID=3442641 RepID=UPI003EBDF591
MQRNSLFLMVLMLLSVMSCDNNQVYDVYKSVPQEAWHKDSIVQFAITPPDTINPYNLFVNLRNTNQYKYSNLFLIVQMDFPHGKTVTDTLEYRMAKPNGEFLGEGFNDLKENKLWYKEDVVFNENGDYTIKIQQAMRENGKVNGVVNLEGITDVGFRIEKPSTINK